MAGEGANAAAGTARAALDLSLSATSSGFSVSVKIENPLLAGILGVGALSLGAIYLARRRSVENAIRNSLEERNENGMADPEVRNIENGSIIVELCCHTERSFLKFFEDFEAKKVRHRLEEEFIKIEINEDFHVTIRNAGEVYNKVQQIRYWREITKTSVTAIVEFEGVNIPDIPIHVDLLELKDVHYKVLTNRWPTPEQCIAQGLVSGVVQTTGQIKDMTAYVWDTVERATDLNDVTDAVLLKVSYEKTGEQSFSFSFDVGAVYKTLNKADVVYKLGNLEVDPRKAWELTIIVALSSGLQREFTSKEFHILREKPGSTKQGAAGTGMNPIHKRVLADNTTKVVNKITSPTVVSAHLSPVFSSSDMEEIRVRESTMVATHGTQTMLSFLENRGPKASGLLTALKNPVNDLVDLADKLIEKERKLGEKGLLEETCSQESDNKDEKPDSGISSQVDDTDDLDVYNKSDYQMSGQEEQTDRMTSTGDDDMFESKTKKEFCALLISSCGKDEQDNQHDKELTELEGILKYSSWDIVPCKIKCKVSNLIQTVHSILKLRDSAARRIVFFVYLMGPTVQINGENYLLPTDLKSPSQADLIHNSLNINWLVKQLSKNYVQIVIVDGAYENATVKDIRLHGVLPGLAPIHPPPNAVIAFPCRPGIVRPEQERLAYIKSVLENLQQEPRMMLADLFDRVRADLENKSISSPVEFSLTSSPLPICMNAEEGLGIQVHSSGEISCHAIIIANCNYSLSGAVETNDCINNCKLLQAALLRTGWQCEELRDESAKDIMEELRKALNKLADGRRREVMLYFMGYTETIMDRNYFSGRDLEPFLSDPYRSGVPLQWALDLMCEKLQGPKLLIVDDVGTVADNGRKGLAEMTAPLDVMISLPTNCRHRKRSFTSNFAHLLGKSSGKLSLKDILREAAWNDPHRLTSNLLDTV